MIRRFLTTVLVAGAVTSATPALAEQPDRESEPQEVPTCCEGHAAQLRELAARLAAAEKKLAEPAKSRADVPDSHRESW